MKRKGITCIFICLCCFVLIGCTAVESQNYNEETKKHEEKVESYEDKAQSYEDKAQMYGEKSSTYFEKFDSEVKSNKYIVNGTANLKDDDENAILVKINSSTNTTISINGIIEYKNGEADLYLISPSLEKKCIISRKDIKENNEIKETVDLEAGCNQIIFKGDNSVVDFTLEFISENSHGTVSYD